jgi:hypothetical protein
LMGVVTMVDRLGSQKAASVVLVGGTIGGGRLMSSTGASGAGAFLPVVAPMGTAFVQRRGVTPASAADSAKS